MILRLPPAGPPEDPRGVELRELVEFCRHQLDEAIDKLGRVRGFAADPGLSGTERVHTRVLLAIRSREQELWTDELDTWTRRLASHQREAAL